MQPTATIASGGMPACAIASRMQSAVSRHDCSGSRSAWSTCGLRTVARRTATATAAAMAIDDGVPVQALEYAKLKPRLVADGQILRVPVGTVRSIQGDVGPCGCGPGLAGDRGG